MLELGLAGRPWVLQPGLADRPRPWVLRPGLAQLVARITAETPFDAPALTTNGLLVLLLGVFPGALMALCADSIVSMLAV